MFRHEKISLTRRRTGRKSLNVRFEARCSLSPLGRHDVVEYDGWSLAWEEATSVVKCLTGKLRDISGKT
jgi:hypothetical protein